MLKICPGVYDRKKHTERLCPRKNRDSRKEVLVIHAVQSQVLRSRVKAHAGSGPSAAVYSVVESVFCVGHTVALCSSQTS